MEFDHINSIIVILLFGSLILLGFVHLTNPLKINKKGNKWFAVFLFLFASFWLEEIGIYTGIGKINDIFLLIVHSAQITTPLVLLVSIAFYTKPNFKFKTKHILHLVLPLIYFIVQALAHFLPEKEQQVHIIGVIIILGLSMFYAVLSYLKIRKHQKSILLYTSNTQGINLNWLEYILLQIIVICFIVVLHNIFVSTMRPSLWVNSVNLITVYTIAYFSLRQKEIFPVQEKQKNDLKFIIEEPPAKEKKKVLPDNELGNFKKRLTELMQKEKPYLDSELNLVKLAEQMNITPHQLSYVINTGHNENFFQFVNRHRVEHAKELLCKNENLTMLAVAFDSGFNSKTSFNTTFKKITLQTPSEFKKTCSNL